MIYKFAHASETLSVSSHVLSHLNHNDSCPSLVGFWLINPFCMNSDADVQYLPIIVYLQPPVLDQHGYLYYVCFTPGWRLDGDQEESEDQWYRCATLKAERGDRILQPQNITHLNHRGGCSPNSPTTHSAFLCGGHLINSFQWFTSPYWRTIKSSCKSTRCVLWSYLKQLDT